MTAFSHIQSVAKDDSANSSTTHSITITSSTAGSVIKVIVRAPAASDTTVSATDNKSQTYTEKNHKFVSGFALFSELFFLGTASGVTTITITLGAAMGARLIAEEYGVTGSPTLAFDGTPIAATVATSTSVNSGNETATGTDDLLLSSTGWNAAGFTPTLPSSPAAWTKGTDIPTSGGKLVTAYLLGQGAGTYSASWATAGTSDDGYASIAVISATSSGGTSLTPTQGTLTLSGLAPSLFQQFFTTAGAGTLALTGYAPSVTIGGSVSRTPTQGALSLTGLAPTVSVSGNVALTPGAGSLSLSGLAPGLSLGLPAIGAGTLTLTGYAPTVTISGQTATPATGSLSIQGYAPKLTLQTFLTPNAGTLVISGFSPAVGAPVVAAPSPGVLSLQGYAPSVVNSGDLITGPTPAGRRRRYYVEIDGVHFDVDNAEQARDVLDRAKRLAALAAEESAQIIERTNRFTRTTIEPVKLDPPRITASRELKLPLKSVRRSINKIYREKSIVLELRLWLELEQRLMQDDEEAMLLLN